MKKKGMAVDYGDVKNHPKFGTFIRAVIGLAYVPLERIEEAFRILQKLGKANTTKRKKFCKDMLEYLRRTWLDGCIPREVWNMFQHPGVATNNHAEGYNYKMGAKHPNPYTLADEIRTQLNEASDTVLADTATSKKKKTSANVQQRLQKRKDLMKDLQKRNVDLETFLVSIGGVSLKYDPRIKNDNDPNPTGIDGDDGFNSDEDYDDVEIQVDPDSEADTDPAQPRSHPAQPGSHPTARPTKYRKGKKQKQKAAPNTRDSVMNIASNDGEDMTVPSLIGDDLRLFRRQQHEQSESSSSSILSTLSAAAMASAGITVLSRCCSSASASRSPRRTPTRRSSTSSSNARQKTAQPSGNHITLNDSNAASARLRQLGFKVSSSQPNTKADGNCMLYALWDQLQRCEHPILHSLSTPHHLRLLICSKLKDQLDSEKIFWVESISPERWLNSMRNDAVWCDQVFLQIFCNLVNNNVILIPLSPSSAHHSGMYSDLRSIQGGCGDPIFMLYFEEWRTTGHYQSIEPDSSTVPNKVLAHYNWFSRNFSNSIQQRSFR